MELLRPFRTSDDFLADRTLGGVDVSSSPREKEGVLGTGLGAEIPGVVGMTGDLTRGGVFGFELLEPFSVADGLVMGGGVTGGIL